jgi:hypothetical protein
MEKTNLFKALANFQQNVPVIHKGTSGYGYTYADLPAIFEVINPILKENGLGFSQLLGNNELGASTIETVIFHAESGESLSSTMVIPNDVSLKGMNEFQVMGSAITYYRRYSLSAILGLVTDKDTDASGEQNKAPKKAPAKKPTPKKKEVLDSTHKTWKNVIVGLKSGYSMEQVKAKYEVSKEVEEELIKLSAE